MDDILILAGAGLTAGAMNALAGGGSFVTLPVLSALGLPSVTANATSALALWPAGAASAWVYRDGMRPVAGMATGAMLTVTLAGGAVGALLLVATPTRLFDRVLPWLLLAATLALAFAPRLRTVAAGASTLRCGPMLALQALLGVYGGYFGGAVGLMMLAAWSLADGDDVKGLHAPRTMMVAAANGAAILCFVAMGVVRWPAALAVGAGAILGGYGAAHLGRRLPAATVRTATVGLCVLITILFFHRAYS